MSEHAIEGLIEDTVHLLDKADLPDQVKRAHLAAIYRIQAFYDTGYTHFRVIDLLLKYRFVYRVPADSFPGSQAANATVPGWVAIEQTGESVYAQQEGDKVFLYVDAGSESWERLCKEGILSGKDCEILDEIPFPTLFRNILQEAEKQEEQELLTNWYGLLVNGYIQGVFSEKEGFPNVILKLAENEELLTIRNIVQRNKVKRLRSADESLMLPVLTDEVAIAGGIDSEFAIRFFLELNKTPEALIEARNKVAKAKASGSNLLDELITGVLHNALAAWQWKQTPVAEKNLWCWYKDEPVGRKFIWIAHEEADKFLMCHFGVEHRLILEWQQRNPGTEMAHVHFSQMAVVSLPEDRQENKKFIHAYGGWKFDITKPAKTLKAQMENFIQDIELAENNYFRFLTEQFPDEFFKREPERLLYLLEEGEDETGIVPAYVLFDNAYSIILSFAYHFSRQGNKAKVESMINIVKGKLHAKERKSAYEKKYIEPFLSEYERKGIQAAMPPVGHYFMIRALMKEASRSQGQ